MPDSDNRARGAVLIVEDEPLLRMNAVEILEDEGYPVIETSSDKAGVVPDVGIVAVDGHGGAAFLATAAKGRIWDRESSVRTVF